MNAHYAHPPTTLSVLTDITESSGTDVHWSGRLWSETLWPRGQFRWILLYHAQLLWFAAHWSNHHRHEVQGSDGLRIPLCCLAVLSQQWSQAVLARVLQAGDEQRKGLTPSSLQICDQLPGLIATRPRARSLFGKNDRALITHTLSGTLTLSPHFLHGINLNNQGHGQKLRLPLLIY